VLHSRLCGIGPGRGVAQTGFLEVVAPACPTQDELQGSAAARGAAVRDGYRGLRWDGNSGTDDDIEWKREENGKSGDGGGAGCIEVKVRTVGKRVVVSRRPDSDWFQAKPWSFRHAYKRGKLQ
jgi:hypothetical protein